MTQEKARILIVDDDEQIADILSLRLESEGYLVDTCGTVTRALDLLSRNAYSLVLLDLHLRDGNGVESLPRFREVDGEVPIFIITAHGDVDSAVKAFSRGANGYIRKPFQDGDLKLQISQAIDAFQMKQEVQRLRRLVGDEQELEKIIPSRDPAMRRLLGQVRTASGTISNVVIYGESGTGKELVARALHRVGTRAKGPFVAINCGAFPETLLESELFGYVKGAFTDARENKAGHILRANGGTLFLDEIGDAPLSIQVRLLRVLQERELLPLGASAPIKVDVRVVAATHRDLRALVSEGKFREDLFYRLQVLPLFVPPLRERLHDVVYLANIFAQRFGAQHGRQIDGFSSSALEELKSYAWPGNVRELQNRIEHAVVMGRGPLIGPADLFAERLEHSENIVEAPKMQVVESEPIEVEEEIKPYREAKESFEKQYVEGLLRHTHGNIARAARIAGKYRTEVYGLIKKYSLDPRVFKR